MHLKSRAVERDRLQLTVVELQDTEANKMVVLAMRTVGDVVYVDFIPAIHEHLRWGDEGRRGESKVRGRVGGRGEREDREREGM